ncbi:hypothetical protein [Streptomyces sp. NPDC051162]|uniref:hypothetical protein n=1 Tax=Streptomyces sp. NPDC051162 TaxID=3154747 RepID=UPI0034146764
MTREQGTRLFLASHDLEEARAADLAELDVMSLIVLVERLRGSLDDIIRLVAEQWGRAAGIRTGTHFDAIYLPADDVETRMGTGSIRDRDGVEARLRAAGLTHGVIVPRTRFHYVLLVPPGTSTTWSAPRTECRGLAHPASYITAPPPTRNRPPGPYWILPPPSSHEQLCDPERVRALIRPTRPGR